MSPDFSDWLLTPHPDTLDKLNKTQSPQKEARVANKSVRDQGLVAFLSSPILCCPEDTHCKHKCHDHGMFCVDCCMPLCKSCRLHLSAGETVPTGLANDNWYGYLATWILEVGVTWMEKTVASPYWTGMTLFTMNRRYGGKRHLLHDKMYQATSRIAFKGQVFSAPMDWNSTLEQLQDMEKKDTLVCLPKVGKVLESEVRICISAGLVSLKNHIREATVRRHVVVQLIRMFKDAGHPDYAKQDMAAVELRARELTDSDDAAIPNGLANILDEGDDDEHSDDGAVDKAATPAERLRSVQELQKHMERSRPQLMFMQRDSDAGKEVEASRNSAFSQFSDLNLRTGSKLLDQFYGSYIPRVFNLTLPWYVGGPDLVGRPRFRRASNDAPAVSLDAFTKMLPSRVESQMRWDWDLVPATWSLWFATKVNLGVSLSMQRVLRAGEAEERNEKGIGAAAAKIYDLLWKGSYIRADGAKVPINGDVSKILSAVGLTQRQRALIVNYQFMSAQIPGTRQIRRRINHLVFSARVVYGLPVFVTVTPSERHSGLIIRLSRYRRNDPGIVFSRPEFTPWIGKDSPSLQRERADGEHETVEIDLPEYDLRKLMTSKDPLACVHAYDVAVRLILPALYGLRMCPECPHCALSERPCMDSFGSNATPMGGSMGRADALIGATEAQKAEGVLHLHFFLFVQMAHQFCSLMEIAALFQTRLVSIDALKRYHDYVRCAKYPDVDAFNKQRDEIEQAWPAYAQDTTLARPPAYAWESLQKQCPHTLEKSTDFEAWKEEGLQWINRSNERLQHVLSHMNHHIHPLKLDGSGERRLLDGCKNKSNPNVCKGGFPLENELTPVPLLVCRCIAQERGLPATGPRSLLGSILPGRNEPNLNAGPRVWCEFMGDNADIKFPMRVPILPETHEIKLYDIKDCLSQNNTLDLMYQVQVIQSVIAGYFGGYSAKMQDVGRKETARMGSALYRKLENEKDSVDPAGFRYYSQRLVRDLEAKGILRTSVETTNLSIHLNEMDILEAECIRTFPTVTFPANLLLKREEIETGKVKGASVVAAVHAAGSSFMRRAYMEAPFDLMYGFRGTDTDLSLLSPFEMLMQYSMEEVKPPSGTDPNPRARLTDEGILYKAECTDAGKRPRFEAGLHYVAIPGENRILLPDLPVLGKLRHRWVWEKRPRPHVPVWNFAKIPRSNISPEENARMLCLYMRPWTLHPDYASSYTPLLIDLRKVVQKMQKQQQQRVH